MDPSHDSSPAPLPPRSAAPLHSASTKFPQMWVGFLIAAILIVLELAAGGLLGWAKVAGSSNPKVPSITGLVIAIWVIYVGGYVYWLWCIYRIHKILLA